MCEVKYLEKFSKIYMLLLYNISENAFCINVLTSQRDVKTAHLNKYQIIWKMVMPFLYIAFMNLVTIFGLPVF